MDKKPVKIEEGRLKEFTSVDTLPNQQEIEELKAIVTEIVKELISIGIPLKSEKLIKLCQF